MVNKCVCFEGEFLVGKVKFKIDFKFCKYLMVISIRRVYIRKVVCIVGVIGNRI